MRERYRRLRALKDELAIAGLWAPKEAFRPSCNATRRLGPAYCLVDYDFRVQPGTELRRIAVAEEYNGKVSGYRMSGN